MLGTLLGPLIRTWNTHVYMYAQHLFIKLNTAYCMLERQKCNSCNFHTADGWKCSKLNQSNIQWNYNHNASCVRYWIVLAICPRLPDQNRSFNGDIWVWHLFSWPPQVIRFLSCPHAGIMTRCKIENKKCCPSYSGSIIIFWTKLTFRKGYFSLHNLFAALWDSDSTGNFALFMIENITCTHEDNSQNLIPQCSLRL